MIRVLFLTALLAMAASPASAATNPEAVCDAVSKIAAREAGLPPSMLRALTRTETGRARAGRLTPWPWTVNMEGAGHWFDDREKALAFARKHHARGATSFDVGCFQINYRWHNKAFGSVEAMFDPLENARYAAKYLLELKAESGSWKTAIGHYHSRTPSRAQEYVARYSRIKAKLKPADEAEFQIARNPVAPVAPAPIPTAVPGSVNERRPSTAAPAAPGGVPLVAFGQIASLLTPARPLFD